MTDYVSDPAHLYGADPQLTARIISQMKSKGSFDQLRKEILADIDTKPAYQNLRQRVENSVNRYLKNQRWNPDIVKNKLRDSLKRHLTEGNYIHVGPVLNQVLTPDLCSQVAPEVDKEICKELGVPEEEEEAEDQSPNNRRPDGGWGGEGGSGHGYRGPEPPLGGGRHNGRAWKHENDYFYPYGGGGYNNRFNNRRGGHRDSDQPSSEEEHSQDTNFGQSTNGERKPSMSQFDEMEFEYSKEEVVELEKKENPKEAEKRALQQLAIQKLKIEEELKRMELEEKRKQQFEEKQKLAAEEKLRLELEDQQRSYTPEIVEERVEEEEEMEEPKTPEMSDGEDSDVPEMQIVEEDSRPESKDSTDAIETTPTEEVKVEKVEFVRPESENAVSNNNSEVEAKFKEPEVEIKSDVIMEIAEISEPVKVEPEKKKEEHKSRDKSKDDSAKKKYDERSKSRDDKYKTEHRKDHSSSSSSSSKRHHSSSSSSKSSSHKSSSSSRQESSSSKSSSSKSKEESKSSSHRSSSSSTSSRRDSDRYKSSSSSRSHRRDSDKYRSRGSSYRRGEDSTNLYYFTNEQSIEMAKNRAYLDEVMIRLDLDVDGYDSLISDSEEDSTPMESFSYQLELEKVEALCVQDILGIEIPGAEEDEEQSPFMEEINANEIIKSPICSIRIKKSPINGGWNHINEADSGDYNGENISSESRLSVVLDKCPAINMRSPEIKAPSLPTEEMVVPPKRKRIVRKMEQRYSTDDLYKPRTTFTSSRRSRE